MEKKSIKEILHKVDPDLNVVSGHRRQRDEQNWLAATGPTCSVCHREYHQGRDGMCMKCWEEKKDNEVEVRDQTGAVSFFGDTILAQITHKARKDQ